MSFWLYLRDESAAQKVAQRGENAGLRAEVIPSAVKSGEQQWLCLFYCPHIPDESILDNISKFCSDLADEFDGKFDGWEACLELPDGADLKEGPWTRERL